MYEIIINDTPKQPINDLQTMHVDMTEYIDGNSAEKDVYAM
jgi:hypothetical protein